MSTVDENRKSATTESDDLRLEMRNLFMSHAVSQQNNGAGIGFRFFDVVLTRAIVQSGAATLYSLGLYVLQTGDDHQAVILKSIAEIQQISALHDYYLKSILNATGAAVPTPSNCVRAL